MIVLRRLRDNSVAGIRALLRPSRIPPERRTPLWPVKGWILVVALLAIVLVAGSMLLFDAYLITQARQLPSWVRRTFEWITWFGNSGWFLYPTGILLLVIAASPW